MLSVKPVYGLQMLLHQKVLIPCSLTCLMPESFQVYVDLIGLDLLLHLHHPSPILHLHHLHLLHLFRFLYIPFLFFSPFSPHLFRFFISMNRKPCFVSDIHFGHFFLHVVQVHLQKWVPLNSAKTKKYSVCWKNTGYHHHVLLQSIVTVNMVSILGPQNSQS